MAKKTKRKGESVAKPAKPGMAGRGGKPSAGDPRGRSGGAGGRTNGADHIEVIARGLVQAGPWILLCRNVKKGYFYLPGGHVEPGEVAGEALCREMREEAGLKVRAGDCLVMAEVLFQQGGRGRHEVNVVFHVEHSFSAPRSGGPPALVLSLEKAIAFDWVDHAAIADVDLRPLVLKAWLVAGGQVSGSGNAVWLSSASG